MDANLILPPTTIKKFCKKHHIKQFSFFGSVLREDYTPKSDIDILVEFEEGHTPGLDFFLIENELTQLIGRKVDLQTPQFLGQEIRSQVLTEAVLVYEQA